MRHLLLLMLALFCAPLFADDLARIKQTAVIKVGIKDNSPPFSQIDPATHTVTGFDIDMALAICRQLGVKPDLKTLESSQRIPLLNNRTVDIIVADMAKTLESSKDVDFSIGYFVTEEHIYGKIGRFRGLDDLSGAAIAVQHGSSLETDFKKRYPTTRLTLVEDKPDMVKLLNAGQVDGIAASMPILVNLLPKVTDKQKFEMSPFPLSVKIYAVAVRKNENGLRLAINEALQNIEKSGEAAKIYDRWFGQNSKTPITRTFTISTQ